MEKEFHHPREAEEESAEENNEFENPKPRAMEKIDAPLGPDQELTARPNVRKEVKDYQAALKEARQIKPLESKKPENTEPSEDKKRLDEWG